MKHISIKLHKIYLGQRHLYKRVFGPYTFATRDYYGYGFNFVLFGIAVTAS
jgi:hypothetical protein